MRNHFDDVQLWENGLCEMALKRIGIDHHGRQRWTDGEDKLLYVHRLNRCNATVERWSDGAVLLRSYATIVAIYDPDQDAVYNVLRFVYLSS